MSNCLCKICVSNSLTCQCFRECEEKDCDERDKIICNKYAEANKNEYEYEEEGGNSQAALNDLKMKLDFNKFIEELIGGDYRLPEK